MKKLLFAIGAIALALTMTACDEVSSVGIDVQRPAAPRNVTVAPSGCGNWGIVSWTAGRNSIRYNHEVFIRRAGMVTHEEIDLYDISEFFHPLERPDFALGTMSSLATLSWNEDSSLSWTANPDIDRVSAIISLTHEYRAGNYNIGVRSYYVFDQHWADYTHSAVIWAAGGARQFDVFVPHTTVEFEQRTITGVAGTAINLNAETDRIFYTGNATRQVIRWEVRAEIPYDGPAGGLPNPSQPYVGWAPSYVLMSATPNGIFTPPYRGTFLAMAVIPYGEGGGSVRETVTIEVSGTPFVPVAALTGLPTQFGPTPVAGGTTIGLAGAAVVPGQATHGTINWSYRVDRGHGFHGSFTPVSASLPLPAAPNLAVEFRAIVENGRWWTEGETCLEDSSLPDPGWSDFEQRFVVNIEQPVDLTITGINWQGVTGFVSLNFGGAPNNFFTSATIRQGVTVNLNPAQVMPLAARNIPGIEIQWEREVRYRSGSGYNNVWVPIPGGTFTMEQDDEIITTMWLRATVIADGRVLDNSPFEFPVTVVP